MLEVKVGKDESIDKALRRFRKLCKENLDEMRKRRHYVKPSDSRKSRKKKSRKE